MVYHLGVDLGTTFTAAALSREGRAEPVTLGSRSVAIPTVSYLAENGELVFGQPAVRRATTEPSRVAREFKRRVGDPTPLVIGGTPIPAEMLMARLLSSVVTEVSATEGQAPSSIAVTHPANWGTYKLDLFRQAIRHVEIEVDHFVPEPVAAASFYASQRNLAPGSVVAVYDLGGGTFDAALVRAEGPDGFSIVGQPDGMERLGGIDFDHAVLRHVAESLDVDLDLIDAGDAALATALGQLRNECVEAKEALSAETEVAIPVMLPNRHTEVRLTRGEFEAMIRTTLDETLVALRRTISSAELAPQDVTAVLLVGGSSRIPLVGQLVAAELNRPIAVDARPKDAIPLGAALTAASAAPAHGDKAGSAPPAAAAATQPLTPPPGQEPPAAPPEPAPSPAASARPKALLWAGAAAALIGAGVLALALSSGGDGDDQTTVNSGETTEGEDGGSSSTTSTTGSDAGLDDLLGGESELNDVLEQFEGTDSGTGETSGDPDPLPGSDWNDDAQAQFVTDCAEGDIGAQITALGTGDPEETCGCLYDEIADSGMAFDEFNDSWTNDEVDPESETGDAVVSAMLSCTVS